MKRIRETVAPTSTPPALGGPCRRHAGSGRSTGASRRRGLRRKSSVGAGERALVADRDQARDETEAKTTVQRCLTSPAHDLLADRGTPRRRRRRCWSGSPSRCSSTRNTSTRHRGAGRPDRGTGTKLTTIYVTHAHADHYLGIGALLERFPGARPLVTPGVVEAIKATLDVQQAVVGDVRRCRGQRRSCPNRWPGSSTSREPSCA
jgi:hypothetical protein